MDRCITYQTVCLWQGDTLPAQSITFTDSAGDPVSIAAASINMTVTKTDTSTPALAYDETDTTELAVSVNQLTWLINAAAMATLTAGTYRLKIIVAAATFTQTLAQTIEVKSP